MLLRHDARKTYGENGVMVTRVHNLHNRRRSVVGFTASHFALAECVPSHLCQEAGWSAEPNWTLQRKGLPMPLPGIPHRLAGCLSLCISRRCQFLRLYIVCDKCRTEKEALVEGQLQGKTEVLGKKPVQLPLCVPQIQYSPIIFTFVPCILVGRVA